MSFTGFNLSNISSAYVGNTPVQQIYYGSNLLWPTSPQHDYSQDYFTIESLQNNCSLEIQLENDMLGTTSGTTTVYYRINGGNWISLISSSASFTLNNTNDVAEIKIEYTGWPYKSQTQNITKSPIAIYGISHYSVKPVINIYGNPGSLSWGDDFINHGKHMKGIHIPNTNYSWRMQFFGNDLDSSGYHDLINFDVVDRSNLIQTTGWDYININD